MSEINVRNLCANRMVTGCLLSFPVAPGRKFL